MTILCLLDYMLLECMTKPFFFFLVLFSIEICNVGFTIEYPIQICVHAYNFTKISPNYPRDLFRTSEKVSVVYPHSKNDSKPLYVFYRKLNAFIQNSYMIFFSFLPIKKFDFCIS